jgi:hypothetical protein
MTKLTDGKPQFKVLELLNTAQATGLGPCWDIEVYQLHHPCNVLLSTHISHPLRAVKWHFKPTDYCCTQHQCGYHQKPFIGLQRQPFISSAAAPTIVYAHLCFQAMQQTGEAQAWESCRPQASTNAAIQQQPTGPWLTHSNPHAAPCNLLPSTHNVRQTL